MEWSGLSIKFNLWLQELHNFLCSSLLTCDWRFNFLMLLISFFSCLLVYYLKHIFLSFFLKYSPICFKSEMIILRSKGKKFIWLRKRKVDFKKKSQKYVLFVLWHIYTKIPWTIFITYYLDSKNIPNVSFKNIWFTSPFPHPCSRKAHRIVEVKTTEPTKDDYEDFWSRYLQVDIFIFILLFK